MSNIEFVKRVSIEQVEESLDLAPKFDTNGVIPCVTVHCQTQEVLMFAYMNEEAMKLTISTGFVHYWSRSREKIWKKGETSGMFQEVKRMLIDDDQDCLVVEVVLSAPTKGGEGASCHVGYRSCFYREVPLGESSDSKRSLKLLEKKKLFDPDKIYKDVPNPTKL